MERKGGGREGGVCTDWQTIWVSYADIHGHHYLTTPHSLLVRKGTGKGSRYSNESEVPESKVGIIVQWEVMRKWAEGNQKEFTLTHSKLLLPASEEKNKQQEVLHRLSKVLGSAWWAIQTVLPNEVLISMPFQFISYAWFVLLNQFILKAMQTHIMYDFLPNRINSFVDLYYFLSAATSFVSEEAYHLCT